MNAALDEKDLADFKAQYVQKSIFREDYMTIAQIIEKQAVEKYMEKSLGKVRADTILDLYKDGVIDAVQARARLQKLVERGEAAQSIVDSALKELPKNTPNCLSSDSSK